MNDSATIQHGLCSIAVVECLKLRALDSLRATCRNVKHQLDAQDAEVWRSRCLARWALLPRVSMAPLGAFLWQVRLRSQNGWLLGRQSSADAHSPALRSSLVIEGNVRWRSTSQCSELLLKSFIVIDNCSVYFVIRLLSFIHHHYCHSCIPGPQIWVVPQIVFVDFVVIEDAAETSSAERRAGSFACCHLYGYQFRVSSS